MEKKALARKKAECSSMTDTLDTSSAFSSTKDAGPKNLSELLAIAQAEKEKLHMRRMSSVVQSGLIQNQLKRLSTVENNHVTLRQKSIIKKEVHEKGSALDRLERCKLAVVNGKAKLLQREISREEKLTRFKKLQGSEGNEDKITKKAKKERAESDQVLIKAAERKKKV